MNGITPEQLAAIRDCANNGIESSEMVAPLLTHIDYLISEVERTRQPDWWYADMAELLSERNTAEAANVYLNSKIEDLVKNPPLYETMRMYDSLWVRADVLADLITESTKESNSEGKA